MAVVYVRGPLGPPFKYTQSNISGTSASLIYIVACDDVNDGPITASKDKAIPKMYQTYRLGNDVNNNIVVKTIDWEWIGRKSQKGWKVVYRATVNYGPRDYSTNDPGDDPDNPTPPSENDSWSFSSSWETVKKPLAIDLDGKRVCNSAGDDFTKPVEVDDYREVSRLTRRENINPELKKKFFSNTVNDRPLWGGEEGEWLVVIVTSRNNEDTAWTVEYQFRYQAGGWDAKPLDQGFSGYDPFSGSEKKIKEPINDGSGGELREPALLNGEGYVLQDGGTPHYLDFKVKRRTDFSLLFLPNWFGGA